MQDDEFSTPPVEVALLRAVLETAAHDLGGLSSALAMHAESLQMGAAGQSLAPVQSISAEIRTLGRQLRELRGPVGGASLAPSRAGQLSGWMARTLRFGRAHLPRGTALEGEVPDSTMTVSDDSAHALTFAVFALLRELRRMLNDSARVPSLPHAPGNPRARVRLSTATRGTDALVTLELFINDEQIPIEVSNSDWWAFALNRASGDSLSLVVVEGNVEFTAPLAS